MGHNFPKEMALSLKSRYGIKTFIETGTYKGDTAKWAGENFDNVITIEADKDRYEKTLPQFIRAKNVRMMFGDSRDKLPEAIGDLAEPLLLWLDAHWMENKNKIGGECPLREELDAINNHPWAGAHCVIIDDLRLFNAPPPPPHDPKQWPDTDEIITELERFPRFITLWNDMIIAVPMSGAELVRGYTE